MTKQIIIGLGLFGLLVWILWGIDLADSRKAPRDYAKKGRKR